MANRVSPSGPSTLAGALVATAAPSTADGAFTSLKTPVTLKKGTHYVLTLTFKCTCPAPPADLVAAVGYSSYKSNVVVDAGFCNFGISADCSVAGAPQGTTHQVSYPYTPSADVDEIRLETFPAGWVLVGGASTRALVVTGA
jgi:hypothetical protein